MGRYINTGLTTTLTGAKKIFYNTAASSQTWTVPAEVRCATFEIWGAGGAGSPSCCCTCYGGSAGNGGAYSLKTIPVTPGSVYNLTVGGGGCGNMCWYNGNACGCCGWPTFVTGAGLSNFCAEGGVGGYWCNSMPGPEYSNAYGGDINLKGTPSIKMDMCTWQGGCAFQAGGAAPFGGGYQLHPYAVGAEANPLSCGLTGIFPGGGSPARHQWTGGWCDCCSGCTGGGADGLVVITI